MSERPRIRIVERFSDVLPHASAGPITRKLDRDGIVEHWRELERIARLEQDAPAAAAWCDEQLRRGQYTAVASAIEAAEARARLES